MNPDSPQASNLSDSFPILSEPRPCACASVRTRFDVVAFLTPALNFVHVPKAKTSNNDFFTTS